MKTILVINDDSSSAEHAAKFALSIAQKMGAGILLANTYIHDNKAIEKILAGGVELGRDDFEDIQFLGIGGRLRLLSEERGGFRPEIRELDASEMDEGKLAQLINKNEIWMIVKGVPEEASADFYLSDLNVQKVLAGVHCPLLLVPECWSIKGMERLVYIVDLRYCKLTIVRYLAEFARPWNADLSIAHLSAKGLPDMAEGYALSVFDEAINRNNYDRLFFNNIREKELDTAVDVMINGLHNDLLVVVNDNHHFERLIGHKINGTLPSHITVPLLIFPY